VSRARPIRSAAVSTLAATTLALAVVGCTSSATTLPYTPYTGVDIVVADVFAGVGCGTQDDQVFRYAVVLSDPSTGDAGAPSLVPLPDGGAPVWASVFSCFTNGAFASITTAPNGGPVVQAWIYAFDQADYQAAQAVDSELACLDPTCPLSVAGVDALLKTQSTFVATCTATPESGDHVLTICGRLQAAQVASDAGADSGEDSSADSATDSSADSGANPGEDATLDSSADGGIDE
jgi:hypothetical protein